MSHLAFCKIGTGSFSGVKQSGGFSDHKHPSGAEVAMGWNYISVSPLCLRRHDTDDLYLYNVPGNRFSSGLLCSSYCLRSGLSPSLRMKAADSSETFVHFYHYIWHNLHARVHIVSSNVRLLSHHTRLLLCPFVR